MLAAVALTISRRVQQCRHVLYRDTPVVKHLQWGGLCRPDGTSVISMPTQTAPNSLFLSGVLETTPCRAPLQPASDTARGPPWQHGVPLREHLPAGVPTHDAAPPQVTDGGSTRAGRGAAGSVQQAAA